MTRIETNATGVNMTRNVGGTADALASEKSRGRAGRAHLVGTTRTRPKALPPPGRHERGEGRGEGSVYCFDVLPGVSFVIRLVVPSKRAHSRLQPGRDGQQQRRPVLPTGRFLERPANRPRAGLAP